MANAAAPAAAAPDRVTFKYVFVPADVSQPLEERELTTTKDDECLSLLNECKRHFRRGGDAAVGRGGARGANRRCSLALAPSLSRTASSADCRRPP